MKLHHGTGGERKRKGEEREKGEAVKPSVFTADQTRVLRELWH
jgi:hypothetical protein